MFYHKRVNLAEWQALYSGVGNPRPRQQIKHKMLAKKRLRIKRNYQVQRKLPGCDKAELVKEYLGDMGHNILGSMLVGSKKDKKVTQNEMEVVEREGENDTSTWNHLEDSRLPDLEVHEDDPYAGHKVGVSKRVQEERTKREGQWWRKSKCPSCKKGFTEKSKTKECHSCSSYTHQKKHMLV